MPDRSQRYLRAARIRPWRRYFIVATIALVLAIVMGTCAIVVPDQVRVIREDGNSREAAGDAAIEFAPPAFSAEKIVSTPSRPEGEESEARRKWRATAEETTRKLDELRQKNASMSFEDALKAADKLQEEALAAFAPYRESADVTESGPEITEWMEFRLKCDVQISVDHEQWGHAAVYSEIMQSFPMGEAEREAWWDYEVHCWRADGLRGRLSLMRRSLERKWQRWNDDGTQL